MSSWSNWPSYDQFLSEAWGWPNEVTSPFFGASNVVVGTNPPYSVSDFLTVYPKFGGAPLVLTGVVTQGSDTVPLDSTAGLLVGMAICPYIPIAGQFLAGLFPFGTTILSIVANTSVTLSDVALNSGAQIAVYSAPFVPLPVINIFINLASASLVQARWQGDGGRAGVHDQHRILLLRQHFKRRGGRCGAREPGGRGGAGAGRVRADG